MKKLLSATAIVLCTSGIALAQTTSGGTSGGMETDTTMGVSSWDQTTIDAFFTDDNMLRPEAELRSGWEALDTAEQDQIRTDCQAMMADAGGTTGTDTMTGSGTSTDTTAGATTGSGTTGTDTTAGTTTGSGTSTDTTASTTTGSGTTGTDTTAGTSTDTTAGATTGSGTSSETTASTTTDSSAEMPDMASVQQLCTHVESF